MSDPFKHIKKMVSDVEDVGEMGLIQGAIASKRIEIQSQRTVAAAYRVIQASDARIATYQQAVYEANALVERDAGILEQAIRHKRLLTGQTAEPKVLEVKFEPRPQPSAPPEPPLRPYVDDAAVEDEAVRIATGYPTTGTKEQVETYIQKAVADLVQKNYDKDARERILNRAGELIAQAGA